MYLGSHAHGPQVLEADLDRVTDSHYEFLGSFLGRYVRTDLARLTYLIHIYIYRVLSFTSYSIIHCLSYVRTCSTDKAKESIIYSYKRHINGFAASLEEEEAAEIASMIDPTYLKYFLL